MRKIHFVASCSIEGYMQGSLHIIIIGIQSTSLILLQFILAYFTQTYQIGKKGVRFLISLARLH